MKITWLLLMWEIIIVKVHVIWKKFIYCTYWIWIMWCYVCKLIIGTIILMNNVKRTAWNRCAQIELNSFELYGTFIAITYDFYFMVFVSCERSSYFYFLLLISSMKYMDCKLQIANCVIQIKIEYSSDVWEVIGITNDKWLNGMWAKEMVQMRMYSIFIWYDSLEW